MVLFTHVDNTVPRPKHRDMLAVTNSAELARRSSFGISRVYAHITEYRRSIQILIIAITWGTAGGENAGRLLAPVGRATRLVG